MARRSKKVEEAKEIAALEVEDVAETDEINQEMSDVTPVNEAEVAEKTSGSRCGGALRAAREEKGLSVREVAEQLRLGGKQVEALETDNFAALPEPTIVKGFIRNYAKFLSIPAEPLLLAYAEIAPEKENYAFALNPGINMKITEGDGPKKSKYILLTVLLLLGLGVWFFYQNYIQKPSSTSPVPEVMDTLPELELPMSERIEALPTTPLEMPTSVAEQAETETEPASETPVEVQQSTQAMETDTRAQEEPVGSEDVEAETKPEVAPEPAVGKTRIVFEVTQETWLSVINTSGTEVYNKILYPGDRDVVDVRRPSEIVVGNAHGATLTVDGKSIDLAPYTRINVARVRLNR